MEFWTFLPCSYSSIMDIAFLFGRYFKLELEAKGAIEKDLPPFLSNFLDRTSANCMYTPKQLRTYTTAHLSGGGWYIDCAIAYTHPSEVQLRLSLDELGTIDMEVEKFAGLNDRQRERAIARRENSDRKKAARLQLALEKKEKKEAEHMAKLFEKKKEKEEKVKAKGKKKDEDGDIVPTSSTVDQSSQMEGVVHTGMKRKAMLLEFTEDVVTQGIYVINIGNNENVNSEQLVLNVSIEEVVENEIIEGPNCYTKIMDFLKKVKYMFFQSSPLILIIHSYAFLVTRTYQLTICICRWG